MKLNKPVRILVGIATAWLMIYPLLFFTVWFTRFFGGLGLLARASEGAPALFLIPFAVIFLLHLLTVLLQFVMISFYVIHIIRNRFASENVRIILALGFFFASFVAMPVYYYCFVWRDQPPAWAMTIGKGAPPDRGAP